MEVTRHYLDGASGHMAKTVGPTAHIAPETRIACLYSGMADVSLKHLRLNDLREFS